MFKKAAAAIVPNYLKETHNFLMSVAPIRFQGGRFAAEKPKKVQNVFSGKSGSKTLLKLAGRGGGASSGVRYIDEKRLCRLR